MKRVLFVLLAACVLSVGISAKTYYITHVAASAAWQTNLILTNAIGPDTEANVVLVDAQAGGAGASGQGGRGR